MDLSTLTKLAEFYHAHAGMIQAMGATTFGGWFLWKFVIMRYVPDALVSAIMSRVELALQGKTPDGQVIADPDDRMLVVRVFAAFVEWAEKKLPDDGMGEQRMHLVLERIYAYGRRLPFIGAKVETRLRSQEPRLIEFINALVSKMNDRLKKDSPKP